MPLPGQMPSPPHTPRPAPRIKMWWIEQNWIKFISIKSLTQWHLNHCFMKSMVSNSANTFFFFFMVLVSYFFLFRPRLQYMEVPSQHLWPTPPLQWQRQSLNPLLWARVQISTSTGTRATSAGYSAHCTTVGTPRIFIFSRIWTIPLSHCLWHNIIDLETQVNFRYKAI